MRNIRPYMLSLTQVGMHYAVASLFADNPESLTVLNYDCKSIFFERKSAGLQKLAYGTTEVNSKVTTSKKQFSFVVLYMGQHHLVGGTSKRLSTEEFEPISSKLEKAFDQSNLTEVIEIIKEFFQAHTFSFFGMFKDEQMKLINTYLKENEELAYDSYRKIYERNYNILNVMKVANLQIPPTLKQNIDDVINIEFQDLVHNGNLNVLRMEELVKEVLKWDVNLNKELLNAKINDVLDNHLNKFRQDPTNHNYLTEILEAIKLYKKIGLDPLLVNLQNNLFELYKTFTIRDRKPIDGQNIVQETLLEIGAEINMDLSYIKNIVIDEEYE